MKKRKKNKAAAETPAAEVTPAEVTPAEVTPAEVTLAEEFGETETSENASGPEPSGAPEENSEPGEPAAGDGNADGEVPAPEAAASEDISASGDAGPEDPAESVPDEPAGDVPFPLSQIVEAILFASQKPVSAKELIGILKSAAEAGKENPLSPAAPYAKVKEVHLREAIEELENACMDPARTYEVRENAAGWQLVTKANFSPWLRQLYPENRSARMSAPAMETLAIIAYRQPITRADIEAVRGVAVDGVMQTLLDRGLVKIAGRAEVPGRPLLYETTQHFMEHFGLKNLDDLPNAGELRTIKLPQAAPAEPAAEPAGDAAPPNAAEPPAETADAAAPEPGPEDSVQAPPADAPEAADEAAAESGEPAEAVAEEKAPEPSGEPQ